MVQVLQIAGRRSAEPLGKAFPCRQLGPVAQVGQRALQRLGLMVLRVQTMAGGRLQQGERLPGLLRGPAGVAGVEPGEFTGWL